MSRYKKNELEDGVLQLVAAQYVESEGEKILKEAEALNREEDGKPGPEEMEQFEKLCRKHLGKEEAGEKRNRDRRIGFYRGVAVALIAMLVIGIGIDSVSATKIPPMNFITKVTDKFTEIKKTENHSEQDSKNDRGEKNNREKETLDSRFYVQLAQEYAVTYLPDGFEAVSYQKNNTGVCVEYYDKINPNNIIEFLQRDISDSIGIDTENATKEFVEIHGEMATVSVKDSRVIIFWSKGEYLFSIDSEGISKEEIIKVAKSVSEIEIK